MFQFRRFPTYAYFIQRTLHGYCPCGLPHSEIRGLWDICSSPRLIAACHVLRRLLMPRHSPCALFSLTYRRSKVHFTPFPLSRKLRSIPLLLLFQTKPVSLGFRLVRGTGELSDFSLDQSEKMVLSRIMQASQIVEIVIVTLRPSGRCSTIKFAILSYGASLLPYLSLVLHCSVFKVRSPALLKPDRNT